MINYKKAVTLFVKFASLFCVDVVTTGAMTFLCGVVPVHIYHHIENVTVVDAGHVTKKMGVDSGLSGHASWVFLDKWMMTLIYK